LLAAGKSSRLGMPKQLLAFRGKSLLQHGWNVALESRACPVVLVLGAHAAAIQQEQIDPKVSVVVNGSWPEGISSSIRCGLGELLSISPAAKAVILMVCDQPFVSAGLLDELMDRYYETGQPIVASKYSGTFGTPALFDAALFGPLAALTGDSGARKIIRDNPSRVAGVDFAPGYLDIDTRDDYDKLLKQD
jgi:molybdenum cofactor cytidylyltransferase